MAIQFEPSVADQLAPAIQNIVGVIQEKIAPNYALQKAMQQALVTNPQLLQNLANVEKASPGLMHRFGLGALSELISSVPETPEAQFAREGKEDIVKAKKTETAATQAKAGVDLRIMDQVIKLLDNGDVKTAADVARRAVGLPTQTAERLQEAQAGAAELEFKEMQEANARIAQIPALQQKYGTVRDIARHIARADGQLTPEEARIIFSSPELTKAVMLASDQLQAEFAHAQQKAMITMRENSSATDRNQISETMLANKAISYMEKSDGAGSYETWREVFISGEAKKRALDLATGTIKSDNTQRDEYLKEIGQYYNSIYTAQERVTDKRRTDLTAQISKLEMQLRKAKDPEKLSIVASINQNLEERESLGGPKIRAELDQGWGKDKVKYVEQDTKRVLTEREVAAIVRDPDSSATLTMEQSAVLGTIMGRAPAERRAAFNKIKATDTSPGKRDSKAVEAYLSRIGAFQEAQQAEQKMRRIK